jgi:protein-S-isoprenylcysteine O-methyltransferase Ste14
MIFGIAVAQAVVLFAAAGTVTWLRAWGYIGLFVSIIVCMGIVLTRVNPELIGHRGRITPGTKRFDKIFYAIFLPGFYSMLATAGVDAVRFNWSFMPDSLAVAGIGMGLAGFCVILSAMAVNAHFESTVRIQDDRGHNVCTRGLYQYVRHPGYVGMILMYTGIPLFLGSWWALVPVFILVVLVIIRTAMEDLTLQKELPGYTEYTRMTRFRLLPHVW